MIFSGDCLFSYIGTTLFFMINFVLDQILGSSFSFNSSKHIVCICSILVVTSLRIDMDGFIIVVKCKKNVAI